MLNSIKDRKIERPCDPEINSGRPAGFGFTLAEVLITLGIIGVVAAMTIPTLMNKTQEQEFKVAYRKAYSVASQAWLTAYGNDELILCDSWYNGACNNGNFVAFKKAIKVNKDCLNDTASCWEMSGQKLYTGSRPTTDALSFVDTSGVVWTKMSNLVNTAGEVLIDTNGSKKPNQFGKDRFMIALFYGVDAVNGIDISSPKVTIWGDMTGAAPASDILQCPSYATHPCYYTSWITGAK